MYAAYLNMQCFELLPSDIETKVAKCIAYVLPSSSFSVDIESI